MPALRLVLATANPHKAAEITDILGSSVTLLPRPREVPDVDETGETLEDNARLKAVALVAATGLPGLADDTGLEVDGLDGAPGVRSARYAAPDATYRDNVVKLLGALRGSPPDARRARFRTIALVRFPDGREVIGEGVVAGVIATEARGDGGFGYDPVFVPDEGDGRTFAEMPPSDKHAISHRARALRRLLPLL